MTNRQIRPTQHAPFRRPTLKTQNAYCVGNRKKTGAKIKLIIIIMTMKRKQEQRLKHMLVFFVDRVINVWNALPSTTNFASLNVLGIALKRLISLVFLVCNIFICVIEYVPSDCFY